MLTCLLVCWLHSLSVLALQGCTLLFGSMGQTTSLVGTLFSLLVAIIFIMGRLSYLPMIIAVGFFLVSLLATTLLLIPVARSTYRVNQAEGDFRFLHARWVRVARNSHSACHDTARAGAVLGVTQGA